MAGIFAVFLFLLVEARGQNWEYHSTARFVIAHSPAQKNLATQVLAQLQHQQEQLSRQLSFQPRRTITVYLCPTQAAFDRLTGGAIPHWGEAAADAAQWRIYLKSPAASADKSLDWQTIKHELAHLMLAEIAAPNRLPRWFNEGAAILLAGETDHVEPLAISRAMATKSLVTFDEIESLLSFPNAQAGLAYSESYHAVTFLVRRHGAEAIPQYAQALAQHAEARAAFQAAFGEDLWDFEIAFFAHLRKSFRWYVLLDDTLIWSGLIVLLVCAGYFVTRWRTKKKMREWELEEAAAQGVVDEDKKDSAPHAGWPLGTAGG